MKATFDKASHVLFWGGVSFVVASFAYLFGLDSFWPLFLTTWTLAAAMYLAFASIEISSAGKAVIITGCDTGIGHATALHLDRMGFRVFACCLSAEGAGGDGAKKLRREGSRRLHVLQLDVTKQEQIDGALRSVKELMPSGEVLWGIVNNAGINPYGAVEWVPMEEYRRTAEVNLFGAIAMTKAFLPLIRKAKGRVINVGSVRGRMAAPLGAAYEVTKYGIEAFSDALRNEMRRFGVDVSIIEPGNFTVGTGIFTKENISALSKKMWDTMDEQMRGDYGKQEFDDALQRQLETSKTGFSDLTVAVEAITDSLTQRFPQSRYQPMQLNYYIMVFINQHFPEWVYDYLYYY